MVLSTKSLKPRHSDCQEPTGYMFLTCPHDDYAIMPLRCRQCDPCRGAYRAKVMARILGGIAPVRAEPALLTLSTVSGSVTWPQVMRAFTSLMYALRKRTPGLQYAAIKEEGDATGMRHLHVVLQGWRYIPFEEISHLWATRVGAPGVDIKRVDKGGGSLPAYVAKYVSKGVGSGGPLRRVTYSAQWPKLPKVFDYKAWGLRLLYSSVEYSKSLENAILKWSRTRDYWPCTCMEVVLELEGNRTGVGEASPLPDT